MSALTVTTDHKLGDDLSKPLLLPLFVLLMLRSLVIDATEVDYGPSAAINFTKPSTCVA